ncbi:MAG TPA: acyltransferase family protein [Microbacterium sp.]|uniref:acyltransferase family protein n=1 Tax=Microbacterium sp. TaxID=51671 RepID=UPI002B7D6D30|nr:acyltransferase family protein [Microbacterium sp.]HWI31643.1 acyltransferase family protein [Microbacterium sp.]
MAGARLDWADVARGGAMILVVFAHTLQLMDVGGWQLGWLDSLNLYLTAIRMPLFFLISGVFAASAIRRTWGGLFASRLALLLYMYFAWMLLRAVWFSVVPWPLSDTHPWSALLISPVWPTNGLWFLYALIVYLVIGRLTARWPAWIPLSISGVVAVLAASDLIPTGGNGVWRSVALYLFFFLLGARLSDLWKGVAARANVVLLVVAVVAIPAGILAFTLIDDPFRGASRVALSVLCVAACLVIAAMAAKVRPLARPFLYVGSRTLPVYVMHAMLLAVLVPLVPVGLTSALLISVALTLLATVIPLALYRVLGPIGGIFNLPHAFERRLAARRTESA